MAFNLSSRNSSAEIPSSSSLKIDFNITEGAGWRKKGMLYLAFDLAFVSWITLWVVLTRFLSVTNCIMSPMLQTIALELGSTLIHEPSLLRTSSPPSSAPIRRVIKLMSVWALALWGLTSPSTGG